MHELAVLSYCSQASFLSGVVHSRYITENTVLTLMSSDGQDGKIKDVRKGLHTLCKMGFLSLEKKDSEEVVYRLLI